MVVVQTLARGRSHLVTLGVVKNLHSDHAASHNNRRRAFAFWKTPSQLEACEEGLRSDARPRQRNAVLRTRAQRQGQTWLHVYFVTGIVVQPLCVCELASTRCFPMGFSGRHHTTA